MKTKVFITTIACIALAACLMSGCANQVQATETSSSAATSNVSAPAKATTAAVTFTVEAPDFTSDSSAAVAHIKKIETDVKADKKSANAEAKDSVGKALADSASEGAEVATEAAEGSDSENATEASEDAPGASEAKVTHEFYHAVNRANEDKAIELDEGTYEITWVSPINIDGAIYETPNEPQTITVKAGEPVEVTVTFTKIEASEVTAEQLTSIMTQLNDAVKKGDDTLTGDAGRELVARAADNAANAPQADTTAINEVRQEAETSAMTSTPTAPSESTAATSNPNSGYTDTPAATQPSGGTANNGGSNNGGSNNSGNNSGASEPAKQKTWVPEQGHYEDIYETVHIPAVTHEEPVYTTVVDQEAYTTYTTIYYTQDGWSGTDRDEARAHLAQAGGHLQWENIPEEHPAVTHEEQTGTTTVVDVPAHDEQQKTGSKWVVDVPGHWE